MESRIRGVQEGKANLLLIGVLLIGLVALYVVYTAMQPEEVFPEPVAPVEPAPVTEPVPSPEPVIEVQPAPEPEPVPEPVEAEPALVLPALNDSDEKVLEWLAAIPDKAEAPAPWLSWLVPKELVRKMVLQVDNIRRGKYVRKYTPLNPPLASFKLDPAYKTWPMDETLYSRYDLAVEAWAKVDKSALVALYRDLSPLFEQAQLELGLKPALSFDSALLAAIDHLLEAPVLEEPPMLHRPRVLYQFKEPALESLSATHKLMLRMGPDNSRKLKAGLRELRAALVN